MPSSLTGRAQNAGDRVLIYLDTSAAMKLVRYEAHSDELSRWISEQAKPEFISSVIIEVELLRATRRSDPVLLGRANDVLNAVGTIILTPTIIARAAGYEEDNLRSLDAVHLATAEHLAQAVGTEFLGFLGYDVRLLNAARALGLPILAPGLL
jgi:predicted nucleic acid-binding protein